MPESAAQPGFAFWRAPDDVAAMLGHGLAGHIPVADHVSQERQHKIARMIANGFLTGAL
jgi:hypothetical protein